MPRITVTAHHIMSTRMWRRLQHSVISGLTIGSACVDTLIYAWHGTTMTRRGWNIHDRVQQSCHPVIKAVGRSRDPTHITWSHHIPSSKNQDGLMKNGVHGIWSKLEPYHRPETTVTTTNRTTPTIFSPSSRISKVMSPGKALCLVSWRHGAMVLKRTILSLFCSHTLWKRKNAGLTCYEIPLLPPTCNMNVIWTSVSDLLLQTILIRSCLRSR